MSDEQDSVLSEIVRGLDLPNERPRFSELFQVVEFLGRGSFGQVLSCVELRSGHAVAVKVIFKEKVGLSSLSHFLKEAQLLASLTHQNIVGFKRIVETESRLFLVMDLLRGGTLRELLRERRSSRRPLSEEEVAILFKGVISGLSYLHARDIIHRDLKPENILLAIPNDLSSARIIDFGLSVRYNDVAQKSFEGEIGTLLYMAPEVVRAQGYTKAVDIFSAGVLLHNLLTLGEHPFHTRGETKWEYVNRLKTLDQLPGFQTIPDAARGLLVRMLAFEPSERFTAEQILTHPFVTRKAEAEPLTLAETIRGFALKQSLANLLKAVFLAKSFERTCPLTPLAVRAAPPPPPDEEREPPLHRSSSKGPVRVKGGPFRRGTSLKGQGSAANLKNNYFGLQDDDVTPENHRHCASEQESVFSRNSNETPTNQSNISSLRTPFFSQKMIGGRNLVILKGQARGILGKALPVKGSPTERPPMYPKMESQAYPLGRTPAKANIGGLGDSPSGRAIRPVIPLVSSRGSWGSPGLQDEPSPIGSRRNSPLIDDAKEEFDMIKEAMDEVTPGQLSKGRIPEVKKINPVRSSKELLASKRTVVIPSKPTAAQNILRPPPKQAPVPLSNAAAGGRVFRIRPVQMNYHEKE